MTAKLQTKTVHRRELRLLSPPARKVVRITARLNVGGIARHVSWLSAGLEAHGYQTTLVTGTVPPGEDDMSEFARQLGVVPLVIPEMSREISLKDAVTVFKLLRLFFQLQPDIIHTHSAKAGAAGRVAAFLYKWLTPTALWGKPRPCRVLHTYHGHVFHSYFGPLKTRLFLAIEKILARVATDRIVVISRQQHDEILNAFGVGRPEQFAIVPLGIDLAAYSEWEQRGSALRRQLKANDGELLVGIVGRLTEIKHHSMFLRAARACLDACRRTSRPCPRFVVIGDGHLRRELEQQAAQLGLEPHVVFLGNRTDPEDFYPALDVVALTSLNEGTPLTLIEAMANARPVISTAVGGVVDLLGAPQEHCDGYVLCERGASVASKDEAGFAQGLLRLLDDAHLRRTLGQRGEKFVSSHYSRERLLDDVGRLYSKLFAQGATADEALVPVPAGLESR